MATQETVCLYQMFVSKIKFVQADCGDCTICVSDVNNKNCKKYYPITLWSFTAKEAENGVKAVIGEQ